MCIVWFKCIFYLFLIWWTQGIRHFVCLLGCQLVLPFLSVIFNLLLRPKICVSTLVYVLQQSCLWRSFYINYNSPQNCYDVCKWICENTCALTWFIALWWMDEQYVNNIFYLLFLCIYIDLCVHVSVSL